MTLSRCFRSKSYIFSHFNTKLTSLSRSVYASIPNDRIQILVCIDVIMCYSMGTWKKFKIDAYIRPLAHHEISRVEVGKVGINTCMRYDIFNGGHL